ncbi:MAG: PGF-pre-PGF domain-containing protein, partial [Methanosarcinales archaeon]|nr:PGF-pre-PGF domain-containing protein [Methanosarcinales archaeon]
IHASDKSGNNASDQVLVTIRDNSSPVITKPGDMDVDMNGTASIEWTITDIDPDAYHVYRDNEIIIDSTSYNNTQKITVPIETNKTGIFTYTIHASDKSGNNASDGVNVTVRDNTSPVISSPDDMEVEQDCDTVNITWAITEPNPGMYRVLRNGQEELVSSTEYGCGDNITVPIDTSCLDTYNYTILANDTSNNIAIDLVNITIIDTKNPIINVTSANKIKIGTEGNITWVINEKNPDKYWIEKNGKEIVPPTRYQSGVDINVSIDSSKLGVLQYKIYANDTSGNNASNQVNITVQKTEPLKILIPSRKNSETTSMSICIHGTIEGIGQNPLSVEIVNDNGDEVTADLNITNGFAGTYSGTIHLDHGTNKITVTATYSKNESDILEIIATRRKERISNKGGGGGGGTAGEDHNNIQLTKTQREVVGKGDKVSYCFDTEGNCNIVMHINFTGMINSGTIPAKVEMLYNTSSLVNYAPLNDVYKNLNMWVGKKGWSNPGNIENATITFKVDKSWIDDNNILISNIIMNRYYEGHWHPLTTSLIGSDDDYCYFTSQTQGFSSFAVTTRREYMGNPGGEGIADKQKTDEKGLSVNPPVDDNLSGINTSTDQKQDSPGFNLSDGLLSLLICLASIIYCKKK